MGCDFKQKKEKTGYDYTLIKQISPQLGWQDLYLKILSSNKNLKGSQ